MLPSGQGNVLVTPEIIDTRVRHGSPVYPAGAFGGGACGRDELEYQPRLGIPLDPRARPAGVDDRETRCFPRRTVRSLAVVLVAPP